MCCYSHHFQTHVQCTNGMTSGGFLIWVLASGIRVFPTSSNVDCSISSVDYADDWMERSAMVGDAVCFGGLYDGKTYDPTADPPFGYRVHTVSMRGQKRKIFLKESIRSAHLDLETLLNALKQADKKVGQ